MSKNRFSNIELLRLVASGGVIALHYNYGHALKCVDVYSNNAILYIFVESIFACCVDLFLLISGYFSYKREEFKFGKAIKLILQVIFIQFIFAVATSVYHRTISINSFISAFIPSNYFVILYIAVMLISPFVNMLVNQLSNKKMIQMIVLSLVLFSVIPYGLDCIQFVTGNNYLELSTLARFGSSYGYSFVNFMLMYLIGAMLAKIDFSVKKYISLVCLFVIWLIMTIIGIYALRNDIDINLAYSYCSPLVIASAVFSFLLFKEINIRQSKIINNMSCATFTIYLTHIYFLRLLNINNYVDKSIWIAALHLIISILLLQFVGYVIYLIWNIFIKIFRIDKLLEKVPVIRASD